MSLNSGTLYRPITALTPSTLGCSLAGRRGVLPLIRRRSFFTCSSPFGEIRHCYGSFYFYFPFLSETDTHFGMEMMK